MTSSLRAPRSHRSHRTGGPPQDGDGHRIALNLLSNTQTASNKLRSRDVPVFDRPTRPTDRPTRNNFSYRVSLRVQRTFPFRFDSLWMAEIISRKKNTCDRHARLSCVCVCDQSVATGLIECRTQLTPPSAAQVGHGTVPVFTRLCLLTCVW